MKKAFFFVAAILISASVHCQWYHRQYGVSDLNQLTKEQLNIALKKANGGVTCGTVLSLAGAIGIVGSLIILKDSNKPENIGKSFVGLGLLALSIPLELTGLVVLGTHRSRVISIKEAMKNTELKIGLINLREFTADSFLPATTGLSVSFRF